MGTGTLTLSEHGNNYTGGTTFNGGVLSVSDDTHLGDAGGPLAFGGGTLRVTGTSYTTSAHNVTLNASGGKIEVADAGNTLTMSGTVSGSGGLTKSGPGTLSLTGTNTYTGSVNVIAGSLIGTAASLSGPVVLSNNANLTIQQDVDGSFSKAISGGDPSPRRAAGCSPSAPEHLSGATIISEGTIRLGPASLLTDTLQSTSLDSTKWTVNKGANGNANVVPTINGVQLVSRGYLNTLNQYDPALTGGLSITGNWTFTNTNSGNPDMLQIDICSSGTPGGTYGEVTNAIEFHYQQGNTAPNFQDNGSFTIGNAVLRAT